LNQSSDKPGEGDVILVGGPADLPATTRNRRLSHLDETKIKIPRLGGYECFELVQDADGGTAALRVFQWTMRTKIAE
jgi:Family of unknown function (DUF5988)